MEADPIIINEAEQAAVRALDQIYSCIDNNRNFILEAGAGAGKTYSLIKALNYVIDRQGRVLLQNHQKIACITFTNVAKHEIDSRTDDNPVLHSDTIHAFCWSLIKGFQVDLRREVQNLAHWNARITDSGLENLAARTVTYDLGFPSIEDNYITISHTDVLELTVVLLQNSKFRSLFSSRYPIVFIDEYQDTNNSFIEAIKMYFLNENTGPLFGFFGDHWQKIYGDGCGQITNEHLVVIDKNSNFRSVVDIVQVLNHMRPTLPQFVKDPDIRGEAIVYQTNAWAGDRRTGGHWAGDLPENVAHQYLERLKATLTARGWDFSPDKTKILMLTHNVLAQEQGYRNFAGVFSYNDQFIKKEDKHVAYFVDILEPMCSAYQERKYGQMFSVIGGRPAINSHADKLQWQEDMDELIRLRNNGTVGNVMDFLLANRYLRVPENVVIRENDLRNFVPAPDITEPSSLTRLRNLRNVQYSEVIAFSNFSNENTPFATKHSVKGAEFDNVLVVIGRGWNQYNFNQMLEWAGTRIPAGRQDSFERSRNLFYVSVSRPKIRLAVLFTQELSNQALRVLSEWFGANMVIAL